MRHMPRILEKNEIWKDVVEEATIHTGALDECISATTAFWNKIKGSA